MLKLIKRLMFGKEKDFTARVLERYRKNKPVSELARSLAAESAETINARFAKVKQTINNKQR